MVAKFEQSFAQIGESNSGPSATFRDCFGGFLETLAPTAVGGLAEDLSRNFHVTEFSLPCSVRPLHGRCRHKSGAPNRTPAQHLRIPAESFHLQCGKHLWSTLGDTRRAPRLHLFSIVGALSKGSKNEGLLLVLAK